MGKLTNATLQYFVNNAARFRRIAHAVEALTMFVLIAAGGGGLTWWYMSHQYEREQQLIRSDHLAEIARMQDTYEKSLKALGEKVGIAAATAETAAATADVASSQAVTAARTADSAAGTANKAAVTADRAATKAAVATGVVPRPTQEQINRSVDAANRALKQ